MATDRSGASLNKHSVNNLRRANSQRILKETNTQLSKSALQNKHSNINFSNSGKSPKAARLHGQTHSQLNLKENTSSIISSTLKDAKGG